MINMPIPCNKSVPGNRAIQKSVLSHGRGWNHQIVENKTTQKKYRQSLVAVTQAENKTQTIELRCPIASTSFLLTCQCRSSTRYNTTKNNDKRGQWVLKQY